MRTIGLLVLLAGLLVAATPAQAFTVMSCWNGTGQDWLEHPAKCTYSTDGRVAARLVNLKWRAWGERTATATGRRIADRRRSDGSRRSSRTTVQVRRLVRCGDTAVYYQEIRLKTWSARYSTWRPLTVPRC